MIDSCRLNKHWHPLESKKQSEGWAGGGEMRHKIGKVLRRLSFLGCRERKHTGESFTAKVSWPVSALEERENEALLFPQEIYTTSL